jgi:hypothetical protein
MSHGPSPQGCDFWQFLLLGKYEWELALHGLLIHFVRVWHKWLHFDSDSFPSSKCHGDRNWIYSLLFSLEPDMEPITWYSVWNEWNEELSPEHVVGLLHDRSNLFRWLPSTVRWLPWVCRASPLRGSCSTELWRQMILNMPSAVAYSSLSFRQSHGFSAGLGPPLFYPCLLSIWGHRCASSYPGLVFDIGLAKFLPGWCLTSIFLHCLLSS